MSLYKGDTLISGVALDSANQSLSNLNSTGQAVIDGKVSKSGDTMTGALTVQSSSPKFYLSNSDLIKGTNPDSTKYTGISFNDSTNSGTWQDTRLFNIEGALESNGNTHFYLQALKNEASSTASAAFNLYMTQAGDASATLNCPFTIQGSLDVSASVVVTRNGTSQVTVKNAAFDYTSTTAPSSSIGIGNFYAHDTNGKLCGGLSISHSSSNNLAATIIARRSISGTEKSAYLTVGVDSSGNPYASAPITPAATSNNTSIATTAFVHNACDGQWIDSNQSMFSSAPSLNSSSDLEYRITLPNDGYNYEVLVRGRIQTGSSTGNYCYFMGRGNQDSYARYGCGARTRANSNVLAIGTILITASYVASGSKNLYISRSTNFTGATLEVLETIAYRRIGSNS